MTTTTLGNLADRVDTLLHGYSLNTENTTWLTAATTSGATTLNVYDATVVSKGFIQVDDEIMYVAQTNNVDNTVTIAPWGRGQRGTTAAAHDNNAKLTVAPVFPRYEIKKAINNTIDAMYPQIFGISQTQFSYVAARTTYKMPADTEYIFQVTWSVIGPSKEWLPIRAWQFDKMANPGTWSDDPTQLGKTLSILNPVVPGRTVNVVYGHRPARFDLTAAESQVMETVTGLPSYAEDVLLYGAAWRMISFLDPSRLGPLSAEADILDNQRGPRAGENAARFLYNIYNQRTSEVADQMRRLYPIRSHYQR